MRNSYSLSRRGQVWYPHRGPERTKLIMSVLIFFQSYLSGARAWVPRRTRRSVVACVSMLAAACAGAGGLARAQQNASLPMAPSTLVAELPAKAVDRAAGQPLANRAFTNLSFTGSGGGKLGGSLPCGAGHAGRSAALARRRHRPRTEAQPAGAAGDPDRAVRPRADSRRLLCASSKHEGHRLHQHARTQPRRHGIQALVAGRVRLPARNGPRDCEGGHHQRAVQRRPGALQPARLLSLPGRKEGGRCRRHEPAQRAWRRGRCGRHPVSGRAGRPGADR